MDNTPKNEVNTAAGDNLGVGGTGPAGTGEGSTDPVTVQPTQPANLPGGELAQLEQDIDDANVRLMTADVGAETNGTLGRLADHLGNLNLNALVDSTDAEVNAQLQQALQTGRVAARQPTGRTDGGQPLSIQGDSLSLDGAALPPPAQPGPPDARHGPLSVRPKDKPRKKDKPKPKGDPNSSTDSFSVKPSREERRPPPPAGPPPAWNTDDGLQVNYPPPTSPVRSPFNFPKLDATAMQQAMAQAAATGGASQTDAFTQVLQIMYNNPDVGMRIAEMVEIQARRLSEMRTSTPLAPLASVLSDGIKPNIPPVTAALYAATVTTTTVTSTTTNTVSSCRTMTSTQPSMYTASTSVASNTYRATGASGSSNTATAPVNSTSPSTDFKQISLYAIKTASLDRLRPAVEMAVHAGYLNQIEANRMYEERYYELLLSQVPPSPVSASVPSVSGRTVQVDPAMRPVMQVLQRREASQAAPTDPVSSQGMPPASSAPTGQKGSTNGSAPSRNQPSSSIPTNNTGSGGGHPPAPSFNYGYYGASQTPRYNQGPFNSSYESCEDRNK